MCEFAKNGSTQNLGVSLPKRGRIPHMLSVLNDFTQMDRTNGSSEVFILKWQTNHNLHRSQNPQNHLKIV